MKYFAAAVAFWGMLIAPTWAFEINEMTSEERDIFRQEVRAYLLENPEVLLEAIGVLERRQASAEAVTDAQRVADDADALFSDKNSFVGGNPDGDVVVVEFLDYRCPFCRRAHPEVAELVKGDGNIKYVIKEFPILGPESDLASRFAIAVLQNTKPATYETVNNTLINFRGTINAASLARLANQLDLDVDTIFAAMQSDEVSSVIAENQALAQRLQINGTPGFVFGDQLISGYVPLEDMKQLVADIRLASR